jgi:hypothetical protein
MLARLRGVRFGSKVAAKAHFTAAKADRRISGVAFGDEI